MKRRNKNMKPLVDFTKFQSLIETALRYQTEGYGTVFIHLQGHVGLLEVRLHPRGWVPNSSGAEYSLCIEQEHWEEAEVQKMNEIEQNILSLMEEQESEEEFYKREQEQQLAREKELYEKLKLKFEGDDTL